MTTPIPPEMDPATEWVGRPSSNVTYTRAPRLTPMRVRVRDIALTLASLCVVLLTALLLYAWASVGSALSEVGTSEPAPTWECTPTPDWPC